MKKVNNFLSIWALAELWPVSSDKYGNPASNLAQPIDLLC